jgi:hypothetical protein
MNSRYLVKRVGEKDICYHESWGWVIWKPTVYRNKEAAEEAIKLKEIKGDWKPGTAVAVPVGSYKIVA